MKPNNNTTTDTPLHADTIAQSNQRLARRERDSRRLIQIYKRDTELLGFIPTLPPRRAVNINSLV
tara:strand:+ start:1219 stop:1413 length:195 start_codon:yes stop_codon:yes gene_type:complete